MAFYEVFDSPRLSSSPSKRGDCPPDSADAGRYTSPDEVAVCNLASIALPSFVATEEASYDFGKLYEVRGREGGKSFFFSF